MPVTPYTEPNIKPITTWPQTAEERIVWLMGEVGNLRQQIADLRASSSALIEALLKTDDGDDDADF